MCNNCNDDCLYNQMGCIGGNTYQCSRCCRDGKDGKNGRDGADGKDGRNGKNGVDGFSPIAKITQTTDGAAISITDKTGTTTANVYNGIDGTNGTDGATPVITTQRDDILKGNWVSIDVNGTKTEFFVPDGKDGADGAAGSPAIIPYASGADFKLSCQLESSIDNAAVGFGSFGTNLVITNSRINFNTPNNMTKNYAFAVSKKGVITDFTGVFVLTERSNLANAVVTIFADVYIAAAGSNEFVKINTSTIPFPQTLTGTVVAGDMRSVNAFNLSIPVDVGDRILVLLRTESNTQGKTTIAGTFSGSIAISGT